MSNFIQTQLKRSIVQMEYISKKADIYGCDIKIKNNKQETDWLSINEDQVNELIKSYYKRLNDC